MSHYVYILKCSDGSYYTGSTNNVRRRFLSHKTGLVESTKLKRPLKLVWYCCFIDTKKAFEFEKYLKIGSGKAFSQKRFI